MSGKLLDIDNLSVDYSTARGPLKALRGITFSVPKGEIVGIVGESGCGKSTLISAILRLAAPNAKFREGSIQFDGRDLLKASDTEMRTLRGDRISIIFQDPMQTHNPVLTVGKQMFDIQHREKIPRSEKYKRAEAMLEKVGISDAKQRLQQYPHEFSGGMRQRIAIAMALMAQPELLIADEPTTALDATLEVQIIDKLKELQSDYGCSILFISHHLGVIAELCDRVIVMYAGEVVETGPVRDIFHHPQHPYTRRLIECDPGHMTERTRILPTIPGDVPDLADLPSGCVFFDRCTQSAERCENQHPALKKSGANRSVACWLTGEATQ